MAQTIRLVADRIELPSAIFRREPYLVAVVVDQQLGQPLEVRSHPISGTHRGRPADLQELELYAGDPGSFLVAKVAVMESDAEHRVIGERLDQLLHVLRDTALGRAVMAGLGLGSAGVASAGTAEVLDLATAALKRNGDDELLRAELRLEAGEHGYELGKVYELQGDRCRLVLRLTGGEASGTTSTTTRARRWSDLTSGQKVRLIHDERVHEGEVIEVSEKSATVLAAPEGGELVEIVVERLADLQLVV